MADHNVGQAATFLEDGGMARLELEGKPVVVARVDGQYYAFGGNCSHYGAPLDKGVLRGHTLMCPWHHACFDVRSGARVEPPALNDLARFPLRVEDGQLVVTLPNDNVREPRRDAGPASEDVIVIIGGGAAGESAAEELLRCNFRGSIHIVSAVDMVPVDRPNLSKDYLAGKAEPDWIPLRGADWFAQRNITLHLNTRVTGIDTATRQIMIEGGEPLRYDRLLLATGATPRHLSSVPGADLSGIHLLREYADAERIIQAAENAKQAVIIGASFIGTEVAASLAGGRKLDVTVVGMETVPFAHILGEEIGRMFQQLHEENGVRFRLGRQVKAFHGDNGSVTAVELDDGERIPADIVVVGIGVHPATDFLKSAGLAMDDRDGSLRVDEFLQTSAPGVYAAGDIARYPDPTGDSERGTRIEHWRVAQQHGIVAARNLTGSTDSIDRHVPFFWTGQWGLSLRYVGHATKWDTILYRGSPAERQFIAFYVVNGALKAAAGVKNDPAMDAIEFILRDNLPLTPEQMQDESFDLVAYARNAQPTP